MIRSIPVFVVVGLIACAGCKTAQPLQPSEGPADLKPGLLIGPTETALAPPPVELPKKEAAIACLRTAQEYETKGQTEEAIKLYEKARTNDPSIAKTASRRLAVLYDKAGDFTKSTAEYEQLIKAHPKDADLLNDYGYSYYCRGDWANAETYGLKAVQIDPNHKKAWTNLGMAQSMQSKWDESFKSYCQAVRPADAHCNVAFAMAAQGKTDEAKAQYRQALSLDPSLRLAQASLARMENPQPLATPSVRVRPSKFDALEASAKVPSAAELEARLIKDGTLPPVVVPTFAPDMTERK